MSVISLVGIVAALFVVISLSEPLADRTRLPYTVVLAIIGTLIGLGAVFLVAHGSAVLGLPLAVERFEITIRASVFLYVLLPTLLFQVSLGLNLRRMADDWVPILVMAVMAVVVATLAIGYALTPFTSLPLMACLMLGAIVATTDPSAVVSIFRNIAAPQRLTRIPLFADLDDAARTRLSKALKARYVQPGDVLMRKGDTPSEVCFIASGAVEVEIAGQRSKLGRGEMFGQLSLLSRQVRRTQITAITHSTLLVLDEARFRRLLEKSEALRAAVRESAEKRGLSTEALGLA